MVVIWAAQAVYLPARARVRGASRRSYRSEDRKLHRSRAAAAYIHAWLTYFELALDETYA